MTQMIVALGWVTNDFLKVRIALLHMWHWNSVIRWITQGHIINSESRILTSIWRSVPLMGWPAVKTIPYPSCSFISGNSQPVRYFFIIQSIYPTQSSSLSVAFMARKSNSKAAKGNENKGLFLKNEMMLCRNELTLWCHLENAFVFPIQFTEHNLKLTNQLWNGLFCFFTYGCSLQERTLLVLGQDIWCDFSAKRWAMPGWIPAEHISLTSETFQAWASRWWPNLFSNKLMLPDNF